MPDTHVKLPNLTEDPFKGIDVPVRHSGEAITLPAMPAEMSLALGIDVLQRKLKEETQTVSIREPVEAHYLDGAVAFQKAMARMFGWAEAVPTPGFWGPEPPQTIDVTTGVDRRMSVVWGRFKLPGVPGYVECGIRRTRIGARFGITGEVQRKDHHLIVQLAELTRQIVAAESIYRAKAFAISCDDDGDLDYDELTFIDASRIDTSELVFSAVTERQITTSLWTPMMHTDVCRQQKIPLKRGVLLSGKYGTGKTLTAHATAKIAVEHGWTFLLLKRVKGLPQALEFAKAYQPCVIFAEDIDRVISGNDRTVAIDDILNTIDGVQSKGTEIMVALTTNHADQINKAMLRPGRLDAVIDVTPPDAPAARKLMRIYGRSLLDPTDDLAKAGDALAGQIPAVIREAVERAKLYAISRSGKGERLVITDADIADAAIGMQQHLDLLETEMPDNGPPTFEDIVAEAILKSTAPFVAQLASLKAVTDKILKEVV